MRDLHLSEINKSFDGTRALWGVTLEFATRAIVALVGPNGAGKTTLVDVVTGFTRPDSGRVWLDSSEITSLAPDMIARKGITRTFQETRLVWTASALDNLLLGRPHQRGERLPFALSRVGVTDQEAANRAASRDLLALLGLADQAGVLAGELSYGQQKLLALGCALATEAHILLLDEPVAGIHPAMTDRILGLLVQVKDLGKLIVFVEHDMAAVRRIADQVIVMDEGKVIAQGGPDEVLARPEIMEAFVA